MPRRARGFTLIEILVAVVIIGIVMSVTVLSMSLASDDRDIKKEARRMMSLIELAQTDSMTQGRDFGIEFMTGAYRFVEYDAEFNRWGEPLFDPSLRLWQLPEGYEFELQLEGQRIQLNDQPVSLEADDDDELAQALANYAPHMLIFSSGDMTPFELRIRRLNDNLSVGIEGDLLGNLEVITDETRQ